MLPTKTNSFDIVAVKSMTIQDLKAELAKTLIDLNSIIPPYSKLCNRYFLNIANFFDMF